MSDRKVLIQLLEETAQILELAGADKFKCRAYANAARSLAKADLADGDWTEIKRLTKIKGVGRSVAEAVVEAATTGKMTVLDQARAGLPDGLADLLRLPGLGPGRVRRIYSELGVTSLGELEYALAENRLQKLTGFGPALIDRLAEGLRFIRAGQNEFLLPRAEEAAQSLIDHLAGQPGLMALEAAGRLRRACPTVDRVVVVAAGQAPDALNARFISWIKGSPYTNPGPGRLTIRHPSGLPVEFWSVPPSGFGSAMIMAVGSRDHVFKLTKLAAEKGVDLGPEGTADRFGSGLVDEEMVYRSLGLPFIPHELREGGDEIELALAGRLPRLVEAADVKGSFHVHTTASDGLDAMIDMARAAKGLGWQYLGLADHSISAAYAGGLSVQGLVAQGATARRLSDQLAPFRLFHGVESDIRVDGALDYEDSVLSRLDYVVASVHSRFGLDREAQTARLVRAASHPAATMLGHLTGRLLLTRPGYDFDLEAVMDACAEHGTALEMNCHPSRLDVDWRTARQAKARGVKLVLNTDAHSADGLAALSYGLGQARKAGLEPGDLINTFDLEAVSAYLERCKISG